LLSNAWQHWICFFIGGEVKGGAVFASFRSIAPAVVGPVHGLIRPVYQVILPFVALPLGDLSPARQIQEPGAMSFDASIRD
jgi:hypothetical protein